MSTYAIGDIQGCNNCLLQLLQLMKISTVDKIIFLGDLVNRGHQSLETLRYIRSLGKQATVVLGNHDVHFLAVSQGIRSAHPNDTFNNIFCASDCKELIEWLRHCPLATFQYDHLLFHAGVLPEWNTKKVIELAKEVQTMLRGSSWVNFLSHMFGNTPIKWQNSLKGYDRLRCILNILTRIRFCVLLDGSIDFYIKTPVAPLGYLPWFDMPNRKTANTTCVFGHWSTLQLILRPNLIGIDTGCVWGGKLTAIRLNDRSLFQVNCSKKH